MGMNDAKLIDEVRKYRCLFDKADENYRSAQHKLDIWELIAAECNYENGSRARKKWTYLRDHYNKIRNTIIDGTSDGNNEALLLEHMQWKYYQQLAWLDPHLHDRKSRSVLSSHDPIQFNELNNSNPGNVGHVALNGSGDVRQVYADNSLLKHFSRSVINTNNFANIVQNEEHLPSNNKCETNVESGLFMESVVNALDRMTALTRRQAKIEIQQVLLKYESLEMQLKLKAPFNP